MNGKFYGVSVGPGDPQLMTIKAVKTIEKCNIIATPITNNKKMLAFNIASQIVDMSQKTILPLNFLMTRDTQKLNESHNNIADTIAQYLINAQDVAMLNLGDISVYSTFAYIMEILTERGFECEMISGVTSFCAVAAKLNTSLTTMHKPIHILPASNISDALSFKGTKVIMKSGKQLKNIIDEIKKYGLQGKTMAVQNCGLPDEKIYKDIENIDLNSSYFTTIIIKD